MAEGSAVKLGERAQLVIEVAEDRNVFRAGLAVLAGEREARSLISAIRSIDGVDQPTVHEGS